MIFEYMHFNGTKLYQKFCCFRHHSFLITFHLFWILLLFVKLHWLVIHYRIKFNISLPTLELLSSDRGSTLTPWIPFNTLSSMFAEFTIFSHIIYLMIFQCLFCTSYHCPLHHIHIIQTFYFISSHSWTLSNSILPASDSTMNIAVLIFELIKHQQVPNLCIFNLRMRQYETHVGLFTDY